jgi:nitrite reductase (NO-forming)
MSLSTISIGGWPEDPPGRTMKIRRRPRLQARDQYPRRVGTLVPPKPGTSVLPGYTDALHGGADGQPSWLSGWFNFWINLQEPRASFFAYLVAVVETLIALAVILGFARKLTYLSAIVFSLLIWSTAEGFGGPYTAGSSDIGTAVIYALVFGALLCFSYYEGTPRVSLDYYLERRIGWWHRIAEVGHRTPVRPADSTPAPQLQQHNSTL